LLAPELTDVDGNQEKRGTAISVFNGPAPVLRSYASEAEETAAVGKWLEERAADDLLPHEIAIFVRSSAELARAQSAAEPANLAFKALDEHVETVSGYVSLCTMHLAKGLEFRAS
jgi:superfamily I DNA/RNA helicase